MQWKINRVAAEEEADLVATNDSKITVHLPTEQLSVWPVTLCMTVVLHDPHGVI